MEILGQLLYLLVLGSASPTALTTFRTPGSAVLRQLTRHVHPVLSPSCVVNAWVILRQWSWDSKSWNSQVCPPWREKLDAGWVDCERGRRLGVVGPFSCSTRQCRDSRVPKGLVVTWPQFLWNENFHRANKSKDRLEVIERNFFIECLTFDRLLLQGGKTRDPDFCLWVVCL